METNELKKDLIIINPLLANIAILNGIPIKRIGQNNKDKARSIFYVEDTPEARLIIQTYKTLNNKKEEVK